MPHAFICSHSVCKWTVDQHLRPLLSLYNDLQVAGPYVHPHVPGRCACRNKDRHFNVCGRLGPAIAVLFSAIVRLSNFTRLPGGGTLTLPCLISNATTRASAAGAGDPCRISDLSGHFSRTFQAVSLPLMFQEGLVTRHWYAIKAMQTNVEVQERSPSSYLLASLSFPPRQEQTQIFHYRREPNKSPSVCQGMRKPPPGMAGSARGPGERS